MFECEESKFSKEAEERTLGNAQGYTDTGGRYAEAMLLPRLIWLGSCNSVLCIMSLPRFSPSLSPNLTLIAVSSWLGLSRQRSLGRMWKLCRISVLNFRSSWPHQTRCAKRSEENVVNMTLGTSLSRRLAQLAYLAMSQAD